MLRKRQNPSGHKGHWQAIGIKPDFSLGSIPSRNILKELNYEETKVCQNRRWMDR